MMTYAAFTWYFTRPFHEGGFIRSGALARPRKFFANHAYFRPKPTLFYVVNNTPGVKLNVRLRFILAACSLEVVYAGKVAITVDRKNKGMAINSYNNTSSL